MGSAQLNLALVDDHPAILAGVEATLRTMLPELGTVLVARHVSELDALPTGEVDVVLLDVSLNDDTDAPDNVSALVARGLRVLLYTQDYRRGVVARCFRAGASGIVAKHADPEDLVAAIRTVAAGEPWLTSEWAAALEGDSGWHVPNLAPREVETMRLYALGLPLKSVARRLSISQETAKEYLIRARRKYAEAGRPAQSKTDLYFLAVEDGHLPPGRP